MMPMAFRLALGACVLTLSACTLGPDFQRPVAALPAQWAGPASSGVRTPPSHPSPGAIDAAWWTSFGDPELTSLVERVATSSLDIRAATLRLGEARAARRMTGAAARPAVGASASYQHARSSQKGLLDISGLDGKSDYDIWQPGIDASWELDLWGRVRRQIESADASVDVSENLRHDVILSAIAETAADYLRLRGVQAQQQIVQQNLDIARHSLALTQWRLADGVATGLDVAEAAAQVSAVEARLPLLEGERSRLINALALLMGAAPRSLENELRASAPLPSLPPQVPVGLPSELAERRPDIREAEARLHVATAEIGVAMGDFYPKVTLSANMSLQARQFSDLGTFGARGYGIGPGLTVPLFDGGRLKGQLALRKVQQQEAATAFQQTVLRAWHEVDDAMTDYAARQASHAHLAAAAAQNRIALEHAQRQYVAGATDFLNVLTVQKDLLGTEQALAGSSSDVAVSLVTLFKALGGGWEGEVSVASATGRAPDHMSSRVAGHRDP